MIIGIFPFFFFFFGSDPLELVLFFPVLTIFFSHEVFCSFQVFMRQAGFVYYLWICLLSLFSSIMASIGGC